MKNLIQFTTLLFLLLQTIGYSQTESAETTIKTNDTILKKQNAIITIETEKFKDFIGKYYLVEAKITLEIIQEKDKMYLLSPGAKDILIQKNETTLHEPIRGVDLESIKDDPKALKFTQNGYETTMQRETSKTQN